MSKSQPKRRPPPDEKPGMPFGTETSRPRGVLFFWIVLYAAWLAFLLVLAARESLR